MYPIIGYNVPTSDENGRNPGTIAHILTAEIIPIFFLGSSVVTLEVIPYKALIATVNIAATKNNINDFNNRS